MRKIRFVAHRGESSVAPENTREAFVLAWRNRVSWGVETDVYLTTDNVLVCMHDPNTRRTCGVDWNVREHSLAQLKTLDAGVWKGAQWLNCRVPTLREVLETMPTDGHIFVEIKSAGGGFPEAFEEARIASGVRPDQISFISFSGNELNIARAALPEYKQYLLRYSGKSKTGPGPELTAEALIAEMRELGVDGVDFAAEGMCYDAEYVKKVHDAGFEFHVWTVDLLEDALELASRGVDSITTNCPAVLAAGWPE
ncbi:MAG: glycerophosphodiester phosphodiesterase family protein [Victivallaceae bacterium]|nr:glycerophosphodiester phosphodiesterase family protein [Victivallaceae bacterium]